MGTADSPAADVRAHDTWSRNKDNAVVFVEDVFESWDNPSELLVSWIDLGHSARKNICTMRWFLRHYTLVIRETSA
jgi:hypothetical protein